MQFAFRLGCTLLAAALAWPAAASPLSTQPEQPSRLTPGEAALLDNEQRVLQAAMTGEDVDIFDLAGSRRRPSESHWLLGEGAERDAFSARGRSFQDQLRGLVDVERADARTGGRAQPRAREENPPFGPELGLAATDWVRDITQSLLHSTLRVDASERGNSVFSVLGMGEFGISASADRSVLTLSAGDEALFSLQRVPRAEPFGLRGEPGGAAPSTAAGRHAEQIRLQHMIEAISEAASHPLSLLVYSLVLGYLLLWALLDQRRVARARSPGARRASSVEPWTGSGRKRVRRRHHRRPEALAREPVPREAEPQASDARPRKRVRMRVRVRVRKRPWRRSG